MNGQELVDYRESLKTDLIEVKTDVKWIKENLERLNSEQSNLEKKVSWLQGVGSFVGIVLGAVLAFVTRIVMGD
jgi:predicted nuclease with TOPRIM domain